jgi:hypothetical protein
MHPDLMHLLNLTPSEQAFLAARTRKNPIPPIAQPVVAMVEYWGAACLEFDAACPCCQAWRLWALHPFEGVPSDEVVSAACRTED